MSQEAGYFLSAYDACSMDKYYGKHFTKLDVPYNVTRDVCDKLKPIFDLIRERAVETNCVRIKTDIRDCNFSKNIEPRDVLVALQDSDINTLKELGYSLHVLYDKSYNGVQYNLCWIGSEVSPKIVMKYYRYKVSQRTPEQIAKLEKCVVCKTKVADLITDPCKHKCICDTCAEKVMNGRTGCPVCKSHLYTVLIEFDNL